jgi:DNA polymerase I-like protein with 3'-5' exonuclease and polymerase domains|tara:strand:- start:292 stop:2148 length:1857 start_codon:yes stop_codon:yes gene_type:complete
MRFRQFIKQSFSRVLAVDTEFRFDLTQTIPEKVVCFVYKDIFTGEVFRYWEHDKTFSERHFNYDDCLLVSFNATAEYGSYLNILHGKPRQMWDCFVENKRLYFPFREKGKFGLIDVCEMYGIPCMSKEEKAKNINTIINNKYYTLEQQKQILDYCQKDVEETADLFLCQVDDIEQQNKLKTVKDFDQELWQIMFRGLAQGCVAQIQRTGVPVDTTLINKFNKYWGAVKDKIIKRKNNLLQVYNDDLTFSNAKFKTFVVNCGLGHRWPLLKSGFYTTNDKVVKKFQEEHTKIKEFRQMRKLLNTTKLTNYILGADGKVRTSLNMFGTLTGRCSPSTAKYPLNASKWARNFIKPSWGEKLYYIDYVAQEPAIMGYLSNDKNLINNYQQGDIYLITAQQIGLIKDEFASKETHKRERKIIKQLFLATGYGQGYKAIADNLGCSSFQAKDFLKKFKQLYSTYDRWIQGVMSAGAVHNRICTPYGWQRSIRGNLKWKDGKRVSIKNQLRNFPIQGTGSDILRRAMVDLLDSHIKVIGPVHDALIISAPIPDDKKIIEEVKEIMVHASQKVVGGPIRVEADPIAGNWKQEPKHQEVFDEIFLEINNYEKELGYSDNQMRATREL